MSGLLIFGVLGVVVAGTGLYNLGTKARKLERTDEDFFLNQLEMAKSECYHISKQFAAYLAEERRKYLDSDQNRNTGYHLWMTKGVENFFYSKVSPRLVDVQRECLVQFSAYPEIIDQVAISEAIDQL